MLSVLGWTQKNKPSVSSGSSLRHLHTGPKILYKHLYVQSFSHWTSVLPRVTLKGKRWEPEPRPYTGMYLWAFAPGASRLSLPYQDSAWRTQCLCCKTITRWHVFTSLDNWYSCFGYISGLCLVQGSPLLTSEALFPLFHVTSFGTRIQKLRGPKELNKNDSLNTSVSRSDSLGQVWFLLLGLINWKACLCFHFLVFLEFIQM